jgi:hypothetical protein
MTGFFSLHFLLNLVFIKKIVKNWHPDASQKWKLTKYIRQNIGGVRKSELQLKI